MSSSPKTSDSRSGAQSFFEQEKEFRGGYGKEVFQVLGWAYRPFLAQGIFWVLWGWVGRVLLLGNSVVLGYWMDALSHPETFAAKHPHFVGWVSSDYLRFLGGLCLAGLFMTLLFRLGFSRMSVKAISSIYDEVTVRVSRFPIRFFDRTPVGRVVTRFSSDYGNMFRMFGGPLSEFLGIIFDLIASFVLLWTSHWLGLACYLLLLSINFGVYLLNKQRIRNVRRNQGLFRSPGVAHFAETVQGAGVIRVFGKEKIFTQRFRRLDRLYIDSKKEGLRINISYAAQMISTTYGIAFLSGVAGLWMVGQGMMSVGALASIMVLLSLAGSNFQMFFDWMAQIEEAFVGVERMNEYLRLPLEEEALLPALTKFPTDHPLASKVQTAPRKSLADKNAVALDFDDVYFRYDSNLPWILKGLQFSVKAGEKIGIIGRTGAGKSSLFQAIQRFYIHEKGQILFDGQVPSTAELRSSIAVIPQDPILFNATVKENLNLGELYKDVSLRKFSDEDLMRALDRVGLDTWLRRFTKPLDVMIDEKGKNLSQGEKQLLVMARMSLFRCPLVLMDEATSSIDPQTEELLVRAMEDVFRGHTQLIIAHRLSTIESCDRILWIKDGRAELYDKPEIVLRRFSGSADALEIQ